MSKKSDPYIKITLATLKITAALVALSVVVGQLSPFSGPVEFIEIGFAKKILFAFIPCTVFMFILKHLPSHIEHWISNGQKELKAWVKKSSEARICIAIIAIAGLSLFMELVMIRWISGLFPVLQLYKNFILLACFCGIGIGYALSKAKTLYLPVCLPVLALTLILFIAFRFGSDAHVLSIFKATKMGPIAIMYQYEAATLIGKIGYFLPILILLTVTFILNVLVLLPVAQFCGFLMEQIKTPIKSYGCNLLGSIAGVVLLFIISWLWIGPVIWFGISAAVILWFLLDVPPVRRAGLIAATACVVALSLPVEPTVHNIYSPYQLIQTSTHYKDGRLWFLASGSYYQAVQGDWPEEDSQHAFQDTNEYLDFWVLPYSMSDNQDSAMIVGAGVGNDPAAALVMGFDHIDAVEIDPSIVTIGLNAQPSHPYHDDRVNAIVNDARGFIRQTKNKYDAIHYGAQDTTILLSHGESARFDTFVFTREGIAESYSRLKDGGTLSMWMTLDGYSHIADKMYSILRNLPDASAPRVFEYTLVNRDMFPDKRQLLFTAKKKGELTVPPELLETGNIVEVTEKFTSSYGEKELDIPEDNWPFFLMEKKSIPFNYIISLMLVLALSWYLLQQFLPSQGLKKPLLPFFFLGAGFMLIETKAITEMGLTLGNTWHVIAITIMAVLIMAYLANQFVAHHKNNVSLIAFLLLFLVIIGGYIVSIQGGIHIDGIMGKMAVILLLTSPMFFSGIIFSTLFKTTDDVSGAMAYNIMGAMMGGILEYSAMKFGYSMLYLIAFGAYAMAWVTAGKNKIHG